MERTTPPVAGSGGSAAAARSRTNCRSRSAAVAAAASEARSASCSATARAAADAAEAAAASAACAARCWAARAAASASSSSADGAISTSRSVSMSETARSGSKLRTRIAWPCESAAPPSPAPPASVAEPMPAPTMMVSPTLSVVRRISSTSSRLLTSSTSLRNREATGCTLANVPRGRRRYRTVTPEPPTATADGSGGRSSEMSMGSCPPGMLGLACAALPDSGARETERPARPSGNRPRERSTVSGMPIAPSGAVKSSRVACVTAPLDVVISKAATPLCDASARAAAAERGSWTLSSRRTMPRSSAVRDSTGRRVS
mmetsp:Transcript_10919/g.36197  ORF Transcript_10919/g.36197 Transcript_10919/m.36197 type:complete len:317 (+) Transcript_10919:777-1727(+)